MISNVPILKKSRSFWSIGLLGVCFVSSWASAQFEPRRFSAYRASQAPTIDGELHDDVWGRALVIDDFFAFESGGAPPAAETTARILWDDRNLYVGFEMRDADIRTSCGLAGQCGHDANLFEGDVIELFVKEGAGPATYYEFEWNAAGDDFDAQFDTRFGPPGTAFESAMVSAMSVVGTVDTPGDTDTSWTVEAAIPWTSLDAFEPLEPGNEWFFTVARYDYYNRPGRRDPALMMSTPGDPSPRMAASRMGFTLMRSTTSSSSRPYPSPPFLGYRLWSSSPS